MASAAATGVPDFLSPYSFIVQVLKTFLVRQCAVSESRRVRERAQLVAPTAKQLDKPDRHWRLGSYHRPRHLAASQKAQDERREVRCQTAPQRRVFFRRPRRPTSRQRLVSSLRGRRDEDALHPRGLDEASRESNKKSLDLLLELLNEPHVAIASCLYAVNWERIEDIELGGGDGWIFPRPGRAVHRGRGAWQDRPDTSFYKGRAHLQELSVASQHVKGGSAYGEWRTRKPCVHMLCT